MKYLFYIAKNYSIPIIKPLVSYLKSTKDKFSFYVSQKVFEQFPEEWAEHKIYRELNDAIVYNPDFVITPGNFVDFRLPGIKVQIFHGLGIEKESHYKIRHFFDVYLTSGPYVTKRFNVLQKKYKYFLIEETGWPKIDYILNFPTKNLKKKLNIQSGKKIVLYAPTFSSKMHSATDLLSTIPRIIKNNETWFVKFHELMNKEIVEKFKTEKPENILIIDSYDITPYLHVSDVLISDTSSVVYEFMALNKPVITYRTQSRFDKGINIFDPGKLRVALDRSFENPDEFQENRVKHLQEINPYINGNISERVFETLKDIKLNNRLPKKKKPLNMIRKCQLLYHEKFKKGYLR